MKYDNILRSLDVPQWLIDNLNDLDEKLFLLWLEKNIVRLFQIHTEFNDLADQLAIFYYDYIPFNRDFM